MYRVLKTEQKGNRILVSLENEISFMLYKGEIRKYNISEDVVISETEYLEILKILYKRARERALYILDDNYKTEKQIRDKLKSGYYPEKIINRVVEYLSEYGLINDLRYSVLYIDYKSNSRSKRQIIQDLYLKGVDKEIIENAFDESDYSEEASLNKMIEKKITKYDLKEPKEVQKLYRYLIGKGYQYGEVKKALSAYIDDIY